MSFDEDMGFTNEMTNNMEETSDENQDNSLQPLYDNMKQGLETYNRVMPMHYGLNRDFESVDVCDNVISVAGIKGGVGKTTIAKELAAMLNMVTIDGQKLKVCLIDCDASRPA